MGSLHFVWRYQGSVIGTKNNFPLKHYTSLLLFLCTQFSRNRPPLFTTLAELDWIWPNVFVFPFSFLSGGTVLFCFDSASSNVSVHFQQFHHGTHISKARTDTPTHGRLFIRAVKFLESHKLTLQKYMLKSSGQYHDMCCLMVLKIQSGSATWKHCLFYSKIKRVWFGSLVYPCSRRVSSAAAAVATKHKFCFGPIAVSMLYLFSFFCSQDVWGIFMNNMQHHYELL